MPTNYTELKTSIADFLDDAELTSYIPDFIRLAEAEIKADLDLIETESIITDSTSTTDHYLSLPTYFSSPIRMHINYSGEQYPVKFTTPEGLNDRYTTAEQMPRYVSLVDGQFEFNAISDQAYEVEILYNKLTTLDGTSLTNEIFPTFLNCYLYGALKHGAIFIKEDESTYERQYEIFIGKISKKNRKKKHPRPLRATTRYSK